MTPLETAQARERFNRAGNAALVSGSRAGSPTVTASRIRPGALGCLAAIALALAWLALAPSPAGAAYVFERKWGTEGSGNGQFSAPRSVAVNSGGDVYVVDPGNRRVQLFDSSGMFVTKWGSGGSGDGEFAGPVGPWGVAADDAGRVYVADYDNDRVQRFFRFGDFLTKWGSGGSGNGRFDNPRGVAIYRALGDVFVSDRGNDRVQKFSLSGDFVDKWGSEGTGDGQFNSPEGVAVNSLAPFALGEVYVADQGNHRIQKFSRFGTFLRKWGTEGSGNGQFSFPRGVAVDAQGDVYVADSLNHRIQKFDSSGAFITKWGRLGSGDGRFRLPTGVAVDPQGNVYVADRMNHRVQKFRVVSPQTVLSASPSDPTNDPAPTFQFSSSRPGATFECRLDAGSVFPCTSPHRSSRLSEGEHSFRVWATDGDGHTDPTPAERSFTVDTVPPETTIDSGPAGAIPDPEPSFEFSSSEPSSSFECDLDEGGFGPCTSPHTVGPLADGVHSIRVRATDEAGNTDPTPATRSFSVATGAPPASPPDDGGLPGDAGPPGDGGPPDTAVTVRIKGKRLLFNRKRAARARIACPASEASPPCAGRLSLRTQRRVRFKGKRRRVVLARSKRFEIAAGETGRVRLRLAKPKRRLIRASKRARRARAIARVADAHGNTATVRKRLRVRAR